MKVSSTHHVTKKGSLKKNPRSGSLPTISRQRWFSATMSGKGKTVDNRNYVLQPDNNWYEVEVVDE